MPMAERFVAHQTAGVAATPQVSPAVARTLLIEGWRGVNHSYALINQNQILRMAAVPGIKLFHRDLPFALPHWNTKDHNPGFDTDAHTVLDALREPEPDEVPDALYRICSPFRTDGGRSGTPPPRGRTVTFMITELGLSRTSFAAGCDRSALFTQDENLIVTSTEWSRARLVEYGFASERVRTVPLGVDTQTFRPILPAERAGHRAALGLREGEIVFLNVGAPLWNKGIDQLLRAFALLRLRGLPVRLLVKDQRSIYGLSIESVLQSVGRSHPDVLSDVVLSGITTIPDNLAPSALAKLFGIADCYVSPYRAEGFNLPVLEAIACSLPVIVTRGGATDDFCTDDTALRITGRFCRKHDEAGLIGAYIEPDFDELVAAMATIADGWQPGAAAAAARQVTLNCFNWERAAQQTLRLAFGDSVAEDRPAAAPVIRLVPNQSDILRLLGLLRPRVLSDGGKVRLGAPHDGGYVLPDIALTCDAVLSIGVGSDVSFDTALAQRGLPVFQYDHTVDGPPTAHERFHFHKLGWGPETGGDFVSLGDMKRQLADAGSQRPLLKFDVEGAEYELLAAAGPDALQAFPVITCEIHGLAGLQDPVFYQRALDCIRLLTRHHAPVHLHANNYGIVALIAGIAVPDVLELSLLRRDLGVTAELARDPVPGPLDRPNHPMNPDICMTPLG